MAGGISESEFTRAFNLLRDDMRAGFLQVNTRLDTLNGQTRQHGESIAVLRETASILRAEDDAQDVALEELSHSYNDLSVLIKTKTKEAVKEVAPSKRMSFSALALGGAIADVAIRLWMMRPH